MFRVQFYSHSGLSHAPLDFDTAAEARAEIAQRIRTARNSGHHVDTLERGRDWEVCEPEGCAMVPDSAGLLSLSQFYPFECPECGSGHDTRDDAAACCWSAEPEYYRDAATQTGMYDHD